MVHWYPTLRIDQPGTEVMAALGSVGASEVCTHAMKLKMLRAL
jgi:hypothetical protein